MHLPNGEVADVPQRRRRATAECVRDVHPYLNVCLDMDGNTQWVNMHVWTRRTTGARATPVHVLGVAGCKLWFVPTAHLRWMLRPAQSHGRAPPSIGDLRVSSLRDDEKEALLLPPTWSIEPRGKQLFRDKQKYYYGCFATP